MIYLSGVTDLNVYHFSTLNICMPNPFLRIMYRVVMETMHFLIAYTNFILRSTLFRIQGVKNGTHENCHVGAR